MTDFLPEMSLFDKTGDRLYLNQEERTRFLTAANRETPAKRVFCHLLHYTGCRLSEALEVHPGRVQAEEGVIVIRTLKQRKTDFKGNLKPPKFRAVPVPDRLLEQIDLVFDLRRLLKSKKDKDQPLWTFSRTTAWLTVKRVMARAEIEGAMATTKGLRHGLGIALAMNKVSATDIKSILGHSDTKTTEIYTRAIGSELRELASRTWT